MWSHFNNQFLRLMKMTPRQYRERAGDIDEINRARRLERSSQILQSDGVDGGTYEIRLNELQGGKG